MATYKKTIGDFGEKYTVWRLRLKGYRILERNYHSRYGEIDIIAKNRKYIVFVEVKTRTEGFLYSPRQAVDAFKQQRCVKTAQYYLMKNQTTLQPRFDVSEIILKKDTKRHKVLEYTYLENAF